MDAELCFQNLRLGITVPAAAREWTVRVNERIYKNRNSQDDHLQYVQ